MEGIIKQGIYEIPFDQYLADPCATPSLSSSVALAIVKESPKHAWHKHPRLGKAPRDDDAISEHGTVAHDLLLSGEGKIVVLEFDDYRTKKAQEARDEARAAGRTPILARRFESVEEQVSEARRFIEASEIREDFAGGESELTMVWEEEGAMLRIRPDRWNHKRGACIHYKTTDGSVNPEEFIRLTMRRLEYGFTLGFYHRGCQHFYVGSRQIILAQEQNAPYACALISLTPAKLAVESARVSRAVATWKTCMRNNAWPAYSDHVHYVEPTQWELAQAEAGEQA